MALPSSGQITLNQIHVEAGGSSGSQVGINDSDVRGLISKGSATQMAFSEWYGASSVSISGSTHVGNASTTTSQFPNGNVNLSSGSKLVVVTVSCKVTGTSTTDLPSAVSCGGVAMTKAVSTGPVRDSSNLGGISSIWYLQTSLSGTQLISCTIGGSTGPNGMVVYEVTGHNTSSPIYSTATASNPSSLGTSLGITINALSGSTIIISGNAYNGNNSINQSATINADFSSGGRSYFGARKDSVGSGNTTYTISSDNSTTGAGSVNNGLFVLAGIAIQ